MPNLVMPDAAERFYLDKMLNEGDDVIVKLYTNNVSPTATSTVGTFTEASGYTPITLNAGDWTVSTVNGVAQAVQDTITFSITVAQTIRGYFIVDAGDSTLRWAQKFDVARVQGNPSTLLLEPILKGNTAV